MLHVYYSGVGKGLQGVGNDEKTGGKLSYSFFFKYVLYIKNVQKGTFQFVA